VRNYRLARQRTATHLREEPEQSLNRQRLRYTDGSTFCLKKPICNSCREYQKTPKNSKEGQVGIQLSGAGRHGGERD